MPPLPPVVVPRPQGSGSLGPQRKEEALDRRPASELQRGSCDGVSGLQAEAVLTASRRLSSEGRSPQQQAPPQPCPALTRSPPPPSLWCLVHGVAQTLCLELQMKADAPPTPLAQSFPGARAPLRREGEVSASGPNISSCLAT